MHAYVHALLCSRKLAFLSVTYIHTYIQTQNEMRSRISCLALRHSAIIHYVHVHLSSHYVCDAVFVCRQREIAVG